MSAAVDLIIDVVCALCTSAPRAVVCDVSGDVTVQRCIRDLVDELRWRHGDRVVARVK